MVISAALLSLCIAILSLLLGATCAVVCWRAVSRCTQLMNALREVQRTPTSAARFETLEAEQVEFASSLQKISKTVKRLSSRYGMEELRERRGNEETDAPPIGAPKTELRAWASRKVGAQIGQGPEFARQQLKYERSETEG